MARHPVKTAERADTRDWPGSGVLIAADSFFSRVFSIQIHPDILNQTAYGLLLFEKKVLGMVLTHTIKQNHK